MPGRNEIAMSLRARIVSGRYQPGADMVSVRGVVDEFGGSPRTARAALRLLADEGLVAPRSGKTAVVCSPGPLRRGKGEQLRDPRLGLYVAALEQRAVMARLQTKRLHAVVSLVDVTGKFLLGDVLRSGEFPSDDSTAGQEAFRYFRKQFNRAAEQARVNLKLELSSNRVPPDQRYGWFCLGDLADDHIAMSDCEVGEDAAPAAMP